jgi:hypothetical protein
MTQPAQPEWRNSDPLVDLIDLKGAHIIVVRPAPGGGYESCVAYCEMKHGWSVNGSFNGQSFSTDKWDPAWWWVRAPTQLFRR